MLEFRLDTGYELPEIYLVEEIIEKGHHPKERGVELLRIIFDKSPEIKVLYAHYSEGELAGIINKELNILQSQRISKEFFSRN